MLHETVRAGNAAEAAGDRELLAQKGAQVQAMVEVLGLSPLMELDRTSSSGSGEHAALDHLVRSLLSQRAQARASRDFARADQIRDQLAEAGVSVADGAHGSDWSIA